MKTVLLLLGVCLSACARLGAAGPSTPAQRERFVQITHSLEKSAFSDDARTERAWATTFIDLAPDIRVEINLDVIAGMMRVPIPNQPAIFGQFILGFATFQLEHPESAAADKAAAYEAAFSSCLKVYRQAVGLDPANQMAIFDALAQKEREGTLREYVANLLASMEPRPAPGASPASSPLPARERPENHDPVSPPVWH